VVKVLIANATILTLSSKGKLVIGKGYVYVSNGIIEAVGEGEPPVEYQYPELLINGDGRVVAPGFSSAFTTVTLYPLRYRAGDVEWIRYSDYMSVLSRTDVYYLAVLSLMEMVSRGISSALITDIFLDNVARAANDVGIYVTLAVPFNCGLKDFDPDQELRILMSRWHGRVENIKVAALYCGTPSAKWVKEISDMGIKVFLLGCRKGLDIIPKDIRGNVVLVNPGHNVVEGFKVVRYGTELRLWRPEEGLGIGVKPSYSMVQVVREVILRTGKHPLDALYSATVLNNKLISHDLLGPLEQGMRANIVMYDTSEPPGWPALADLESVVRAIVEGDLSVETVLVGDDVLVDNKETLTVGYDIVKKAVSRLEPILRKFLALP